MMLFDVDFINPLGNPGTIYAIRAVAPEDAIAEAPEVLAVSSQWRPDQFQVVEVRLSIYSKDAERNR